MSFILDTILPKKQKQKRKTHKHKISSHDNRVSSSIKKDRYNIEKDTYNIKTDKYKDIQYIKFKKSSLRQTICKLYVFLFYYKPTMWKHLSYTQNNYQEDLDDEKPIDIINQIVDKRIKNEHELMTKHRIKVIKMIYKMYEECNRFIKKNKIQFIFDADLITDTFPNQITDTENIDKETIGYRSVTGVAVPIYAYHLKHDELSDLILRDYILLDMFKRIEKKLGSFWSNINQLKKDIGIIEFRTCDNKKRSLKQLKPFYKKILSFNISINDLHFLYLMSNITFMFEENDFISVNSTVMHSYIDVKDTLCRKQCKIYIKNLINSDRQGKTFWDRFHKDIQSVYRRINTTTDFDLLPLREEIIPYLDSHLFKEINISSQKNVIRDVIKRKKFIIQLLLDDVTTYYRCRTFFNSIIDDIPNKFNDTTKDIFYYVNHVFNQIKTNYNQYLSKKKLTKKGVSLYKERMTSQSYENMKYFNQNCPLGSKAIHNVCYTSPVFLNEVKYRYDIYKEIDVICNSMMEIFKIAKENKVSGFTQQDFELIQTLYNDSRHQLFFSFKQRYTKSKSDILFFNNFLTNIYVEFINLYDDKVYNQIIEYIEPKMNKAEWGFNEDIINMDNVIMLTSATINIIKYFSIYMNNRKDINESVSFLFSLSTLDTQTKTDQEINRIADKFIEHILGMQSLLSGGENILKTSKSKSNKKRLEDTILDRLSFDDKDNVLKKIVNHILGFTTHSVLDIHNWIPTLVTIVSNFTSKVLHLNPMVSFILIPISYYFKKLMWNKVENIKARTSGMVISTIQTLISSILISKAKETGTIALRAAVSNVGTYNIQKYRLKNKQYLEILRTFALHPVTCNFIFEYLYDMRQYVVHKISNALYVKYKKRKDTHFTTENDLSLKHEYISMICEEILEYIEYKEFEIDIDNYFITEKLKNFKVFIKFMISNYTEGKYLMKFTIKHFVKILLRNYLSELLKKYDFETLYQMFNPKDCLKIHNPFSKYYYIRLQTKENKYPKDSFMHHLYLLTNTKELDQYMKDIMKDISSDNPIDIKTILEKKLNHIDDSIVQNVCKNVITREGKHRICNSINSLKNVKCSHCSADLKENSVQVNVPFLETTIWKEKLDNVLKSIKVKDDVKNKTKSNRSFIHKYDIKSLETIEDIMTNPYYKDIIGKDYFKKSEDSKQMKVESKRKKISKSKKETSKSKKVLKETIKDSKRISIPAKNTDYKSESITPPIYSRNQFSRVRKNLTNKFSPSITHN